VFSFIYYDLFYDAVKITYYKASSPSLFRDVKHRSLVACYQCFRTAYLCHLQGSRSPMCSFHCLIKDVIDMLSRNVGNQLPTNTHVRSWKSEDLNCTAAEMWKLT